MRSGGRRALALGLLLVAGLGAARAQRETLSAEQRASMRTLMEMADSGNDEAALDRALAEKSVLVEAVHGAFRSKCLGAGGPDECTRDRFIDLVCRDLVEPPHESICQVRQPAQPSSPRLIERRADRAYSAQRPGRNSTSNADR